MQTVRGVMPERSIAGSGRKEKGSGRVRGPGEDWNWDWEEAEMGVRCLRLGLRERSVEFFIGKKRRVDLGWRRRPREGSAKEENGEAGGLHRVSGRV